MLCSIPQLSSASLTGDAWGYLQFVSKGPPDGFGFGGPSGNINWISCLVWSISVLAYLVVSKFLALASFFFVSWMSFCGFMFHVCMCCCCPAWHHACLEGRFAKKKRKLLRELKTSTLLAILHTWLNLSDWFLYLVCSSFLRILDRFVSGFDLVWFWRCSLQHFVKALVPSVWLGGHPWFFSWSSDSMHTISARTAACIY